MIAKAALLCRRSWNVGAEEMPARLTAGAQKR